MSDLFNPTPEHLALRQTLRRVAETEVEAQAAAHDRDEAFNLPLFRKLGELGVLGLTVPEAWGGSGMDAAAVAVVHEVLRRDDAAQRRDNSLVNFIHSITGRRCRQHGI